MNAPTNHSRFAVGIERKGGGVMFLFDADRGDQANELLRALGRAATNPCLDFTWYDAAVISQRVRNIVSNHKKENQCKP